METMVKVTTPVNAIEKPFEVWVRENQPMITTDPEGLLKELYILKKQARNVEIKLATRSQLAGFPPVFVKGGLMIVRLSISGLFLGEEKPTIIEGKLLRSASGKIYIQVFQDRYRQGVETGKGKTKAEINAVQPTYLVRGALTEQVVKFLQPENIIRAITAAGLKDALAFFGQTVEEKKEESAPDFQM
jgi:hypothetical protein